MWKLIFFQYFITLVVFFWIGLFMSAKWLFLEFQRFTNWLIYWDQKNISRRYVKRVFDRASYGLFFWNENFDQRKCRNFISSSERFLKVFSFVCDEASKNEYFVKYTLLWYVGQWFSCLKFEWEFCLKLN